MNFEINDALIPGTRLLKAEMGNVTGLEFLSKVFYISDGVMLSQIREVSGIDGSTLQNWTKRGWVANARLKKYNIDQVAHILIINMLRSCIQLDRIALLLQYINGNVDDMSDDIIRDSILYDYICRVLDRLMQRDACSMSTIKDVIADVINDYEEAQEGARDRLANAMEIIIVAYYANLIKHRSDEMLAALMNERI
jgi:predicted nucleotidyltransferase